MCHAIIYISAKTEYNCESKTPLKQGVVSEGGESGMKPYDYVLVGSGLYAGGFAWYAKQRGRT